MSVLLFLYLLLKFVISIESFKRDSLLCCRAVIIVMTAVTAGYTATYRHFLLLWRSVISDSCCDSYICPNSILIK